jgi:hypothetical protein
MANDYLTLADLAVINSRDLADIDVSDLLQDAPLVAALSAVPATNGNLHKYYKTTGAPVVGFRAENDGREHDSTIRTAVTVTLKILDASFTVDVAHANAYIGGPEALIQMELMEHMKAAYFKLEQQILNGTGEGDSGGFGGLEDSHDLLNANSMILNAGGSTALSSVYIIRAGQADVSVVAGDGGNIEVGETIVQRVSGATTGFYPAYFTPVSAWYGLQVGSVYSSMRIANVDAGSNSVTDSLIYTGLKEWPAGRQPTHIVMNRRSLEQLRNSRTATNATGTPAPRPTDVEGIPIIVTDALANDETLVTA